MDARLTSVCKIDDVPGVAINRGGSFFSIEIDVKAALELRDHINDLLEIATDRGEII